MKDVYYELDKAFGLDGVDNLEEEGFTFKRLTIYLNGKRITVKDVVYYYYRDARNITSGCRSIGPLTGDWRPIDNIAKQCLEIYKVLKRDELKRECKKYGMELRT